MTKFFLLSIALFGQGFGADITGQAFLKTQGGDVKTCAGNEVYLEHEIPNGWVSSLLLSESSLSAAYSAAALSDMKKKAGLDTTDINEDLETLTARWKTNYDIHLRASKKNVLVAVCDSQGNFEFNNIKNGRYAIATRVEWKAGDEKQGGVLGDFIDIKQKKQKIFLTK